jgi:hypothetical protein
MLKLYLNLLSFLSCLTYFSSSNAFLFKSNIETLIYTDQEPSYVYNLLDRTDYVYKKSGLDIQFYVEDIRNTENIKNISSFDIHKILRDNRGNKYNSDFDLTILLLNFEQNTSTKGVAYINRICTSFSVMIININNVNDEMVPYIIAHELGHLYGAIHDNTVVNIMNSELKGGNTYRFNENSKERMDLNRSCLFNIPQNYLYKTDDNLISGSNRIYFDNNVFVFFFFFFFF